MQLQILENKDKLKDSQDIRRLELNGPDQIGPIALFYCHPWLKLLELNL